MEGNLGRRTTTKTMSRTNKSRHSEKTPMPSIKSAAGIGAVLAFALAGAGYAQQPAAAPRPQAVISKDPAQTVAGTYRLDPNHASIIARMAHAGGFSLSTFRFGAAKGTLNWNPQQIEASKVDITVETKSILTPVPDFAEELIGDRFLNAAKYPEMRFVSTSIRRTGPTTGQITGDLTFNGVTKPLVVDAALVGGGKNGRQVPVIGFTGTAKFNRQDFGFTANPGIGNEIELILDLEFNQPLS
jgi:polyisoprenoid-binding protein YceI